MTEKELNDLWLSHQKWQYPDIPIRELISYIWKLHKINKQLINTLDEYKQLAMECQEYHG